MSLSTKLIAVSTKVMIEADNIQRITVSDDYNIISIQQHVGGRVDIRLNDLMPSFKKELEARGLIIDNPVQLPKVVPELPVRSALGCTCQKCQ